LQAQQGDAVRLVSPADGETVYMPHPHFRWARLPGTKLEDAHQIQIARDRDFADIEVDDSLEVVSRFVSVNRLAPGTYFWRVRNVGGERWSRVSTFALRESRIFPVKKGATSDDIAAVVREAAQNTPANVLFEKGEYRISKKVNLRRAKDLIIDGGGSTFLLDDAFLGFTFCARITLQNMTIKPTVDAGTHVDILDVDAVKRTVTVKPQAGFPQDVHRFFTPGKGAGLMRCVDKANPGKVHRYAGISMADPGVSLTGPDGEGRYTFHNVKETTFRGIKPGMTGALLKYTHGPFLAQFSRRVTASNITLLGTAGAFVHGTDDSALSVLSCRFLPRTPRHYLGAQGFITGGVIGMWVEGCEFAHAPDDNMAVQTLKLALESIDVNGVAVLRDHPWIHEIRAGDDVLLWHVAANTTAVVGVRDALDKNGQPVPMGDLDDRRPKTLRLAKGAAQLNAELGRAADVSFEDVLLFRYSPNNQDSVFRKNRILGGSAGCMYNGMRGLIADNTFTNCRGVGIRPGYHSPRENSGYGARDVLVRNNVVENCGGAGIEVRSTANAGGNIIIKNNTISNTDIDNGLFHSSVKVFNDCDNVVVKDNIFKSTVKPDWGAWITTKYNSVGVKHRRNRVVSHHTGVPMLPVELWSHLSSASELVDVRGMDTSVLPPGVERVDIFLLMGQSNMKGRGKIPASQTTHSRILNMNMANDRWYAAKHPLHKAGEPDLIDGSDNAGVGPGLAFARELVKRDQGLMAALIPVAKGGSSIGHWGVRREFYQQTVRKARKALADFPEGTARIAGALWLQGESDARKNRHATYSGKLDALVARLRADLDRPKLPFIACTIGTFIKPQKFPDVAQINTSLLGLPERVPHTACVDARDLKNGHRGDLLHYNTDAQQTIGRRYVAAYHRLTTRP